MTLIASFTALIIFGIFDYTMFVFRIQFVFFLVIMLGFALEKMYRPEIVQGTLITEVN